MRMLPAQRHGSLVEGGSRRVSCLLCRHAHTKIGSAYVRARKDAAVSSGSRNLSSSVCRLCIENLRHSFRPCFVSHSSMASTLLDQAGFQIHAVFEHAAT